VGWTRIIRVHSPTTPLPPPSSPVKNFTDLTQTLPFSIARSYKHTEDKKYQESERKREKQLTKNKKIIKRGFKHRERERERVHEYVKV